MKVVTQISLQLMLLFQLLIFQAVAESLDLAPTEAELETYASYTESMGEGYVHLLALQDSVLSTLRDSAVVS